MLIYLLGGSVLAGAGGAVTLGPTLEKEAIKACFDNSQTALNVAAQHGQELVRLNGLILDRTQERWTRSDALRTRAEIKEEIDLLNKHTHLLERELEKHRHATE